ncbi:catalase [Pseudomonas sp. BN415]|uniref:catalase n=1 Tax=Pseudomonas sp. BN415 TaxID=2567889 RepID=UPI0024565B7F|nr:catalase [Pseudomonas sp. BN415]MDH4582199.1 catalase [Pseudomonas sp. BN415]
MSQKPTLTTTAGNPVGDNQNSLSAGSRGPLLLQDYHLIEKLAHQNCQRIPERVVHAKGWGAYGTLTTTNDITRYSKASVFSEVGNKTEVLARFSTVAGELGAADAEIKQAAFSPSNLVPGIVHSPDKMLQARVFSYADAHCYRLGTHYEALPVNAPRCPVHHYHKDGAMRFFSNNPSTDAYYEPNSFGGPAQSASYAEPPPAIDGAADRYGQREGSDDYSQPRALFLLFDEGQKQRLFGNIAGAMAGVWQFIVERQFAHFDKVPSGLWQRRPCRAEAAR